MGRRASLAKALETDHNLRALLERILADGPQRYRAPGRRWQTTEAACEAVEPEPPLIVHPPSETPPELVEAARSYQRQCEAELLTPMPMPAIGGCIQNHVRLSVLE